MFEPNLIQPTVFSMAVGMATGASSSVTTRMVLITFSGLFFSLQGARTLAGCVHLRGAGTPEILIWLNQNVRLLANFISYKHHMTQNRNQSDSFFQT